MQWLRLDQDDSLLSCDEAKRHLQRMPRRPLGLVAIFGAARQGKSFLMNKLAGPRGCGFRVSNKQVRFAPHVEGRTSSPFRMENTARSIALHKPHEMSLFVPLAQDPCTVGVDLAENTMALRDFAAIESNGSVSVPRSNNMLVGFVDAEGQGDRDAAYDARIACPVLLAAQSVLFNWRDSLQKDRILNLLGVMCRAARTVQLDSHGGGGAGGAGERPPFGNLHIVFRDWNFDGDVESVRSQLLDREPASGEDSERRNEVRRMLVSAFESIDIWLLPPPVERTRDLNKVLKPEMLSAEFNEQVASLRCTIAGQLIQPRAWAGRPITGPDLARLIPLVADALNRDGMVMPR